VPSYRVTLEYDGRDFQGWQAQGPGRRTVQGTLEQALAELDGAPVPVAGAGRTDAGVHAEGQVASFRLGRELEPDLLGRALNGLLPPDVAVREAARTAEGFHARRDARSKVYRYALWNGPLRSPLREGRQHWVRRPLDLEQMRRAARDLEGTHDFASLQSAGSGVISTVRTLFRVELRGEPGGEIELWVEGDGFLRHMVRALAGTLLEVGSARRAAESMAALLAARRRAAAGPTAPAQALTLIRVDY
jgi:tRNA pseudouridine38-40 synthase